MWTQSSCIVATRSIFSSEIQRKYVFLVGSGARPRRHIVNTLTVEIHPALPMEWPNCSMVQRRSALSPLCSVSLAILPSTNSVFAQLMDVGKGSFNVRVSCSRFIGFWSKRWFCIIWFLCVLFAVTVCEEPEVPRSSYVTGYDFTVGSVITYHCEEGHVLRGPIQRTCREDGEWSPAEVPECQCEQSFSMIQSNYYSLSCLSFSTVWMLT